MTGHDLRSGRESKGWTQERSALKLGVSQPYLSLLENGTRPVPRKLARKASTLFRLSPTTLPVDRPLDSVQPQDEKQLASELASLGYPGLSHLKAGKRRNPAEVLLSALSARNLDTRLVEGLPWLLLQYPELDWQWLVKEAKVRDLQNRLGFVTNVARRLAERQGKSKSVELLRNQESLLERSRLFLEDTLCHESLTTAERRWLKTNRPAIAKHWRLLTDLSPEHLSYAT